ncbi:hypothetical protein AXG93_4207s1040 [Marchantia polymorpha subsp. ruderalis]|uniref:Uncharacterized protein n=1 Tax=Marchantia polymorpha subsp. ruderalis TaxID=1480154 RepID=A0A176VWQ3_MARPO|nr:hypothetical protein AXG93_4207s1040 [Marchantia polymorpha subsp. ruderalis]
MAETQDSVDPLLKYLDGKQEKYVVTKELGSYAKEMACEVLRLNLAKEECRAKEERKTEDFWRQIVAMKTEQMKLWGRIGARTKAHNRKLQRMNELMASLVEEMKKHKVELADWVKKLTDC